VIDLSSLYLDILKDRLYTSPKTSVKRRSAQTAMYHVLESMTRLMAPILSFTSDELWQYLPKAGHEADSVHVCAFPEPQPVYISDDLETRWQRLLEIRERVTKALEVARQNKRLGHPLDARIVLRCPARLYSFLEEFGTELREFFIVSQVELVLDSSLVEPKIEVQRAEGKKCQRCWVYDTSVGTSQEHPQVCHRCIEAMRGHG
jgi:isoleucyl-tRNA synthetase